MSVFISYRTTEKEFALRIAQALLAANIAVWMDRLGGIEGGKDWILALQEGLKESEIFVVVLSPAYTKSQDCRNELRRAIKLGKPIFPVLLETIDTEDYPLEIDTLQYIDFEKTPFNQSIKRLIKRIDNELNLQKSRDMLMHEAEFLMLEELDPTEAATVIYVPPDPNNPNETETQDAPKISTKPTRAVRDEADFDDETYPEKAAIKTNPPMEPTQSAVQVAAPDEGIEWASVHRTRVKLVPMAQADDYVHKLVEEYQTVRAFAMSKHPITNAQFRKFYEDDGYLRRHYWTDLGWELKQRFEWSKPRSWEQQRLLFLAKANLPVVCISWYEALAYTWWLSEKLDANIRLPTDKEWQSAAQHTSRHNYPWGEDWDASCCNNSTVHQSSGTTPVGHYENGKNGYGIYDLIGNVAEWSRTCYKTGRVPKDTDNASCVIRGGAWITTDREELSITARNHCPATTDSHALGFRIVRLETYQD